MRTSFHDSLFITFIASTLSANTIYIYISINLNVFLIALHYVPKSSLVEASLSEVYQECLKSDFPSAVLSLTALVLSLVLRE